MAKIIALAALAGGLSLAGCGEEPGHGSKPHSHGSESASVAIPARFADAVGKCEELSGRIGGLIASGKLSEVHGAAEGVRKIAEKLPELAQKDLPPAMLKDVNVKAKDLAGLFDPLDKAAHAGKKEETEKLHAQMKALVSELKAHAGHAEHKDHK